MKKIVLFVAIAVMVLLVVLPATTLAGEKKAENLPVIGAVLGVLEIPVSTIKNAVNCDSFLDCINLPKHLGEGAINGAERVLGTTFLLGSYERNFGTNSKISQNKIVSNLVGWAGLGLVAGSLGATNTIFSINSAQGGMTTTGAIVGAGAAGVDVAVEGDIYDKDK